MAGFHPGDLPIESHALLPRGRRPQCKDTLYVVVNRQVSFLFVFSLNFRPRYTLQTRSPFGSYHSTPRACDQLAPLDAPQATRRARIRRLRTASRDLKHAVFKRRSHYRYASTGRDRLPWVGRRRRFGTPAAALRRGGMYTPLRPNVPRRPLRLEDVETPRAAFPIGNYLARSSFSAINSASASHATSSGFFA